MRRHSVIPTMSAAVLFSCPGALGGQQTVDTVETSAVSRFHAAWEAPRRLVSRSINQRFTPMELTGRGDLNGYFLLAETFDIHQITPGEGVRGVVKASLRPLRPEGIGDAVWSAEARGSESSILWSDRLYRVTDHGCCGARDTDTYFSLDTGSELFTGTGSIARIVIPGMARIHRFVAFHDGNASVRSEERESDKTVVGVLYYGDDRSPASRLVFTDARSIVYVGTVSLLVGGSKVEEYRIRSGATRDATATVDSSVVGGFSILIELGPFGTGGAAVRIEVPVVSDSLAVDQARVPEGIRIRRR